MIFVRSADVSAGRCRSWPPQRSPRRSWPRRSVRRAPAGPRRRRSASRRWYSSTVRSPTPPVGTVSSRSCGARISGGGRGQPAARAQQRRRLPQAPPGEHRRPGRTRRHSYGGSVITDAAHGAGNVKALVYVAAFIPDKGESVPSLSEKFPGSALRPVPLALPDGSEETDYFIDQARFHRQFAADVPRNTADLMAVTQRPVTASALAEGASEPAWQTVPSWALVATEDLDIPVRTQIFMAERARSHITEVRASHAVSVSHPTPSPTSSRRRRGRSADRRMRRAGRQGAAPPDREGRRLRTERRAGRPYTCAGQGREGGAAEVRLRRPIASHTIRWTSTRSATARNPPRATRWGSPRARRTASCTA